MIGTLIASHGKLAEGMLDSVKLIVGEFERVDTVMLIAGQDFVQFQENMVEKIKALDEGDGVLVFVDVLGGSPYNASMRSYQPLKEAGTEIRVVTGMNLQMVMEALMERENMTLDELAKSMVEMGSESIHDSVAELLQTESGDEADGDY